MDTLQICQRCFRTVEACAAHGCDVHPLRQALGEALAITLVTGQHHIVVEHRQPRRDNGHRCPACGDTRIIDWRAAGELGAQTGAPMECQGCGGRGDYADFVAEVL